MPTIRVLVAEDSVTLRTLLVQILERDPAIRVIGEARTGEEAVRMAMELRPDLITMDVHMPVMDGLAATKQIMAYTPTPILIVSSSQSGDEVEMSLESMRAGALMLLRKPDDPAGGDFESRQGHLVSMVKALSQVKVVRRVEPRVEHALRRSGAVERPAKMRVVVMAASTGGPAALARILAELPATFGAPVLVVQHIAAGFTAGLAEWLNAQCALTVRLAADGEPSRAGTVYIAPDNHQLGILPDGRLRVETGSAESRFRPSADHLFESAAHAFGTGVVALILTGMGNDGTRGLREVRRAGGHVLAQDEASSVVYGMPREAVAAGVVDAVLPLGAFAPTLITLQGRSHG